MVFAKRLREGVVRGDITCSVRIWTGPHVTEGCRYRMGDGEIEIESVTPIGFPDITPELARESGFLGVLDLLKVAKHGKGTNICLIRFHYIPPRRKPSAARTENRKRNEAEQSRPKQNAPDSFESWDVCRSALPQVLLNQETKLTAQLGKWLFRAITITKVTGSE
jgi:hypothetical protein